MTIGRVIKQTRNANKTAGEEIFDTHFHIETQTYNTIDEEFTRIQGEFTTGDQKVDRQLAKRPSRVWRTINELLDFWHSGIEFTLVGGMKDIERINTIIQQHLQDCEDHHIQMRSSLKTESIDDIRERMADLRELDDFGKFIYNRVRNFGKGRSLTNVESIFNVGRSVFDKFEKEGSAGSLRNASDYVTIDERIQYAGLNKRKRSR